MSFIEFHDLTHCYNLGQKNEHRAIDGLDLSIEKGSFTAILG